jgi:hypothetical protein
MFKKTYIPLLFILLLIICRSCSSGPKITQPVTPRPDWVNSRPIIPGYYIGIGAALKTHNIHQYQQTAKQNALSDLAGEISVSISSNSVLHAFESKLGFREDFSSTIQARTQEELEGFDIVDTWEDNDYYWVYYRLSAARHREIKETRKNNAVRLSLGLFENAVDNREKGNLRMSIVQMINSMEAIKNYFDEPLPAEFRNKNIQLGNEIFNELTATIAQLEIMPGQSPIGVKRGQDVPGSLLRFQVINQATGPVSDFPLLAAYSERPVRNNRNRTGSDGFAHFGIDVVRSVKSFETFTVRPDIESILAEATTDPMMRRLVNRFTLPEGIVRINISRPVIMLIAAENNIDTEYRGATLRESFRKKALEEGYTIGDNPAITDYIVRITASTIPDGESGTYKNALLTGTISAELPDGSIVYFRELDGFRGSHFDFNRAGEEAFRQVVRRMESSFFREIDEAMRKSLRDHSLLH